MIGNADERYDNVVDDDDDKIVMMMMMIILKMMMMIKIVMMMMMIYIELSYKIYEPLNSPCPRGEYTIVVTPVVG